MSTSGQDMPAQQKPERYYLHVLGSPPCQICVLRAGDGRYFNDDKLFPNRHQPVPGHGLQPEKSVWPSTGLEDTSHT